LYILKDSLSCCLKTTKKKTFFNIFVFVFKRFCGIRFLFLFWGYIFKNSKTFLYFFIVAEKNTFVKPFFKEFTGGQERGRTCPPVNYFIRALY